MARRATNSKRLSSKVAGSGKTNPSAAFSEVSRKVEGATRKSMTAIARENGTLQDKSNNHLPNISANRHNQIRDELLTQLAPHVFDRAERNYRYDRTLAELAVQQFIRSDEFKSYQKNNKAAIRNIRYPKTYGHLRDLTTNTLNTLFPMRQMYGSIATTPEDQQVVTAFLQSMNKQAKQFNHYTNYYKTIFDGYAFNAGITRVRWNRIMTTTSKLQSRTGTPAATIAQSEMETKPVYEGNEIEYLDPYNCFWDEQIEPTQFTHEAEFFAYVERVSDRKLHRMSRLGQIILPEPIRKTLRRFDLSKNTIVTPTGNDPIAGPNYYGTLAKLYTRGDTGSKLSHGLFMDRPQGLTEPLLCAIEDESYADDDGVFDIERYIHTSNHRIKSKPHIRRGDNELLHTFTRISPKDYGLGPQTNEIVYEFIILNGEHIVAFQPVSEAHGLLPITITSPAIELGQGSTPSVANILTPYQYITNSLLGIYTSQAIDDANNGILAYDAQKVDMSKAVEDRSGRLAVTRNNPEADNIPLGNFFAQLRGNPANAGLLNAEAIFRDRVNDFAPTASANQLANMNRPVSHQSRQLTAVMNLHTQVTSRIIAEQMIQHNNYMQSRNIMLYSDRLITTGPDGQRTEIDPANFIETDMSVLASDGMRGLDTIAITDRFDKLLNSIYQSPELRQEFDIPAMTGFLLQMEGANIDIDAFRHPDPFSALTPEQKQAAYQLLQQAIAAQAESGEGQV